MHCRAVTARVKAGKTQEAIDLYEKSVVPAARLQKGFQDAYLMVDPATGRALSISIWDSQSEMVEGERVGYYRDQVAKFRTMLAEAPVAEHHELKVAVHKEG